MTKILFDTAIYEEVKKLTKKYIKRYLKNLNKDYSKIATEEDFQDSLANFTTIKNKKLIETIKKLQPVYVSGSGSTYYILNGDVIRYSNHWGRVRDSRWFLDKEVQTEDGDIVCYTTPYVYAKCSLKDFNSVKVKNILKKHFKTEEYEREYRRGAWHLFAEKVGIEKSFRGQNNYYICRRVNHKCISIETKREISTKNADSVIVIELKKAK